MNTKARGTLRCRWRHRKRSIDVGDGNYPAALLKISPRLFRTRSWTTFFCLVFCFVCFFSRVFFACGFFYMIYTLSCFWRFIIHHLGEDSSLQFPWKIGKEIRLQGFNEHIVLDGSLRLSANDFLFFHPVYSRDMFGKQTTVGKKQLFWTFFQGLKASRFWFPHIHPKSQVFRQKTCCVSNFIFFN